MKKNLIASVIASLLLAAPAFAETARVSVNGMVCAFCAQGIKKSFSAKEAVEKVDVNLDKKVVAVDFKKDKSLTDDELTDVIKRAGYAVTKIEREGAKK
jgi:periplasmic mercuric ion binding protein